MSTHKDDLTIPKTLYLTYKTKDLPETYRENIGLWHTLCPDWEIHYYTDEDIFAFFEMHYPDYFSDLEKVSRGVILADLFRYAILSIHGGVYTDIDTYPLRSIPEDWLKYQAVIGYEYQPSKYQCESFTIPPEDSFCQWTLLSQKNHPLFKKTLDKGIQNLRDHEFVIPTNHNILELTGPLLFTSVVKTFLPDPQILVLDMDAFSGKNIQSPLPLDPVVMHQNHGMSRWLVEKWLPHLNIE